jgi:hypothetical protein
MKAFRLLPVLCALIACDDIGGIADPPPGSSTTRGIVWTAQSEVYDVAPTHLRVRITGQNGATTEKTLYYGACNTRVSIYKRETDARPVWDSNNRHLGCILPLYSRKLLPGDTMSFVYDISIPDLMDDSIADGIYFVRALAVFDWDSGLTDHGETTELNAGQVTLRRQQDALPSTRTHDGIKYVATSIVQNDSLRVSLSVTNLTTVFRTLSISNNCPFSVFGFKNRTERNAAFSGGNPELVMRSTCATIDKIDLAAGATRTIVRSERVSAFLSGNLPGTYYLALSFNIGNYPGLLSAGDVTLQ